jgi:hypothetical protein
MPNSRPQEILRLVNFGLSEVGALSSLKEYPLKSSKCGKWGALGWSVFYILSRVAKWFPFIPKIPVWVYFGGPLKGNCWYIL